MVKRATVTAILAALTALAITSCGDVDVNWQGGVGTRCIGRDKVFTHDNGGSSMFVLANHPDCVEEGRR